MPARSLVELRVLDGPNLYFPRPAVKVVLDASAVTGAAEEDVSAAAAALGLPPGRPGAAGSGQRQRFALRVVARLVRRVAAESGVSRLAVRARAGTGPDDVVVAFPWRRRGAAEALAEEVAAVLDDLGGLAGHDRLDLASLAGAVAAAGARVAAVAPGPAPTVPVPRVPVVAVTGTNGKTTTTRLVAHLGRCAGLSVGWTTTDGIYLDGRLVEEGDWSGFGGAGRVLAEPGVDLAVLETARGGMLRRGVGAAHNDVAVVTNVATDHLGLGGVETLDQLAEVKATIVRITRPTGWVVLNGDDPRTLAMRSRSRARPFVFSLDPDAPGLRAALDDGGRGATVLDGDVVVLDATGDPVHLIAVVDVPVTMAGASSANVANVLAATAAGLGVGLPRDAVVRGLATFTDNPGRMNLFDLGGRTVVLDQAHNEAGTAALLEVLHALRRPGAAVRLAVGTAGDRRDHDLVAIGEVAARGADQVVVAEKPHYLRGREPAEMVALLRAGVRRAAAPPVTGVDPEAVDVPAFPDERSALEALVEASRPGDVVGVMCHEQRAVLVAWLADRGATALDAGGVRARVAAGGKAGAAVTSPR